MFGSSAEHGSDCRVVGRDRPTVVCVSRAVTSSAFVRSKNSHCHDRNRTLVTTTKAKPVWILLKQVTVSGSGISWAICKSAPRSRQITMPEPHHSVFLQAGCPSCCSTNSVKELNTKQVKYYQSIKMQFF